MVYLDLFITFALIGFTSFGGMSMIPLINSQMLSHGWMTLQEVADIVAIAEMTPGPLGLNCATFAGHRTAGILGATAASLGVLLPSFTLCMMAAMFYTRFRESQIMSRMMYGIRPVAIGMIGSIIIQQLGVNYVTTSGMPSPGLIFIGITAIVLLVYRKWTVPRTILVCAALGLLLAGF